MEKSITVDLFLRNAEKLGQKNKIKIFIEELGAEVEFDTLDRAKYLDLIVGDTSDRDAEIIYYTCEALRDDNLIERLECKLNPVEVVGKVLSGNSIYALASTILKESGYSFENDVVKVVSDEIKNS
ncbi:regulator [Fusobacterium necrophorum]|uniref:regulator n=1 Tax=Fusobacterium necrophorum TaxID=859 RepID=UPI002551429C|nr:regulator [Fusobacterium necrophorum]MDK4472308.1 regulator [Fusobacterium necrophorum]MDK4478804.1 regulator [Fusobacterium necrophorum]MDK4517983.1 regulator [Fusobacterium necrophorum]